MTPHSPTPWSVKRHRTGPDADQVSVDIVDASGEVVAVDWTLLTSADLEFLITRVNAHEALVEALKAAMESPVHGTDDGPFHAVRSDVFDAVAALIYQESI